MALGPEVMLASSSSSTPPEEMIAKLTRESWFFELKFDGIRAIVTRTADGEVQIFNRRRADITHRYPDVVAQLSTATWVGMVDGEIVVPDAGGRPTFALAHLRDAQSSDRGVRAAMAKAPAMFMPFDALEENGFDLRNFPYTQRRERLAAMFEDAGISVISNANEDGATMWKFVQEHDLEGLVAKRPDSAYRPGRQKAWVKIKSTHRISALVCGVIAGKGSRSTPIGALRLCLWDPAAKALVPIGNVGSGLSDRDVSYISHHLDARNPIVVEVEYLEVSASRQLRMPIFRGMRMDVAPMDCVISSLR
jgi:bifunctional non-homologous end joining protein LigD